MGTTLVHPRDKQTHATTPLQRLQAFGLRPEHESEIDELPPYAIHSSRETDNTKPSGVVTNSIKNIFNLYYNLKQDGWEVGSLSDFYSKVNNPRLAYNLYVNLKKSGYDVGEFPDFIKKVNPFIPAIGIPTEKAQNVVLNYKKYNKEKNTGKLPDHIVDEGVKHVINNSVDKIKNLIPPVQVTDRLAYYQNKSLKELNAEYQAHLTNVAMSTASGNPYDDGLKYLKQTDPVFKEYVNKVKDLDDFDKYKIESKGIQINLMTLQNGMTNISKRLEAEIEKAKSIPDEHVRQAALQQIKNSEDYRLLTDMSKQYEKYLSDLDNLADKYPSVKKQVERVRHMQQYYDKLPSIARILYDAWTGLGDFGTGVMAGAARSLNAALSTTGIEGMASYYSFGKKIDRWQESQTDPTMPTPVGGVVRSVTDLIPNMVLLGIGSEGADALMGSTILSNISRSVGLLTSMGVMEYGNYYDQAIKAGKKPHEAAIISGLGLLKDAAIMSLADPAKLIKGSSVSPEEFVKQADSKIFDYIINRNNEGIKDWLKQYVKGYFKQAAEQTAGGVTQAIAFDEVDKKFDDMFGLRDKVDAHSINELKKNIVAMGLTGLIMPTVMHAMPLATEGISKFKRTLIDESLYEAAKDPLAYSLTLYSKAYNGDIKREDAEKIDSRIRIAEQAYNEASKLVSNEDSPLHKVITLNIYNRKELEDRLSTVQDPVSKKRIQDKIDVINKYIGRLVGTNNEDVKVVDGYPVTDEEYDAIKKNEELKQQIPGIQIEEHKVETQENNTLIPWLSGKDVKPDEDYHIVFRGDINEIPVYLLRYVTDVENDPKDGKVTNVVVHGSQLMKIDPKEYEAVQGFVSDREDLGDVKPIYFDIFNPKLNTYGKAKEGVKPQEATGTAPQERVPQAETSRDEGSAKEEEPSHGQAHGTPGGIKEEGASRMGTRTTLKDALSFTEEKRKQFIENMQRREQQASSMKRSKNKDLIVETARLQREMAEKHGVSPDMLIKKLTDWGYLKIKC